MRVRVGAFVLLCPALLVWGVFATGAAAQSVAVPTPVPDPRQVINAFELARGSGNVEGALNEFTDNGVVIVQGRSVSIFNGKDQVRGYLQAIGRHFQTVMRSTEVVEANRVTWTERDQYGDQAIDATVVAIVNDGRIVSLTYRDNEPISPRAIASLGQQNIEIPSVAWPAGLALLGIALLGVVFGRPRRKTSPSQLDGRLLVALRQRRELEHFERGQKAA